eukprot:3664413-Amphidinium_carterae.1
MLHGTLQHKRRVSLMPIVFALGPFGTGMSVYIRNFRSGLTWETCEGRLMAHVSKHPKLAHRVP